MQQPRSKSEEPNPFWSVKAQQELQLRALRPSVLPAVPSSTDGEEGRLADLERPGSRKRSRTPAWSHRSQTRERPVEMPESWQKDSQKSEGHMELGKVSEGMNRGEVSELERELELEILLMLREQNTRLHAQVQALTRGKGSSSAATTQHVEKATEVRVSGEHRPPPPRTPPISPRTMYTPLSPSADRFTLNGTKVPAGPPPVEHEEGVSGELAWPSSLEPWVVDERAVEKMRGVQVEGASRSHEVWGRSEAEVGRSQHGPGAEHLHGHPNTARLAEGLRAHEHGCGAPGGLSIQGHPQGLRAYEQSGRSERPGCDQAEDHGQPAPAGLSAGHLDRSRERLPGGTPSPREARMAWLEREVEMLRKVLHEQHGNPPRAMSDYWGQPVGGAGRAGQQRHEGARQKPEVEERVEDSLRSFPITLPRLVEPNTQNAALQAGDWLAQVRPLIADTSMRAGVWWDQPLDCTMKKYATWLEATPLQRFEISSPAAGELPVGHERLEQRVTNMLLAAVPQSIKNELVATRQLTPQGILFKVLRVYQPGGLSERSSVLWALTNTKEATSAHGAVEGLRLWHRQLLRTMELKATLPDPTLLIGALDHLMRRVLSAEAQATFRVNTFRLQNSVDVRPTPESVHQFYEALLAEAEMLVGMTGTRADQEEGDKAVVKAVTGSPHKPEKTKLCTFWGTDGGCRYGKNCRLAHTVLEDRNSRCWNCSSKRHRKAECPFLRRDGESTQTTSRGSEVGDGRGQGNGKGNGKSKAKGKKDQRDQNQQGAATAKEDAVSATTSTVASASTTGIGGEGEKQKEAAPSTKKVESEQAGTGETAALVTEMTNFLRSLRTGEPKVKVCQVRRMSSNETAMTLLDGGATHCLRQARDAKEWREGVPINVKLAKGEVQMRQNAESGTLLAQDPVQPLIPVSKLIDIGCLLTWTREKCRLEHMIYGVIPLELYQGCPVVDEEWGSKLMDEVENFEKRRARVRALLACGMLAEGTHEKKVAELSARYPSVPYRLLEQIPGEEAYDVNQVPLNRRARRKVERADQVVIHMYSGPNEGKWRVVEKTAGVAVLCIDLKMGHNVMDGHLTGYIQSVIDSGKVVAWLSGPPCRSVSTCRSDYDGGPPRLRDREGPGRFGREGLSATQQQKVDVDSILFLKNMTWIREEMKQNGRALVVVEQPRDPKEWKVADGEDMPSFLCWEEVKQFGKDLALREVRLDQGALGHRTRKPTTLLTNMPELVQLDGLRVTASPGRMTCMIG